MRSRFTPRFGKSIENLKRVLVGREMAIISMLLALLCALLTGLISMTTPSMTRYDLGDHQTYIYMAENPLSPVKPPFAYRILIPIVVWILPLPVETAFFSITVFCLVCLGVTSFFLFREYVNAILSLCGIILLFSLEFGPRFLMYDFWLPDAATYLLVVGGLLAIKRENPSLVLLTFTLGVLCKETILLIVPVVLMQPILHEAERSKYTKLLAALVPGLFLFVLVRLFVPVLPKPEYDFFFLLRTIGIPRIMTLPDGLYRYTITPWGLILFALPLLAEFGRLLAVVKEYGLFFVLVYCQLLVAKNIERLLVMGFVPVVLASLLGVDRLSGGRKKIHCLFLTISAFYFFYRLLTNVPFDSRDPFLSHVLFVTAALLVMALARLIPEDIIEKLRSKMGLHMNHHRSKNDGKSRYEAVSHSESEELAPIRDINLIFSAVFQNKRGICYKFKMELLGGSIL